MRKKDWRERLHSKLRELQQKPFAWGYNDCVTFAADCAEVMTGEDPIKDIRGTWSNKREALKAMKDYSGSAKLVDCCNKMLESKPIVFASVGDVIVCDGENGQFVAVVVGHTAVGPTSTGLQHVPIASAIAAYEV